VLKAITAPGGFSYVQRKVDLAHSTKVEELGLEGIGQHPDTIRTRPQGPLAGQLIGAVSEDGKGLTGLELGEDSTLHGVDGERQLVNDALGDPISLKTLTDAQMAPRSSSPSTLLSRPRPRRCWPKSALPTS
jgi:cell division protein FtsI/penicillin-binding protein 2